MSEILRVGFSGSQFGMSQWQRDVFAARVAQMLVFRNHGYARIEFHHRDCIGADAQAWWIFVQLAHYCDVRQFVTTVSHPGYDPKNPMNASKRAFTKNDKELHAHVFLDRNRKIVQAVDVMFFAPLKDKETLRSDTWATWRFAKSVNQDIVMLERLPRPNRDIK